MACQGWSQITTDLLVDQPCKIVFEAFTGRFTLDDLDEFASALKLGHFFVNTETSAWRMSHFLKLFAEYIYELLRLVDLVCLFLGL